MSDVNNTPAPPEPGVMGSLPKTRPQRPSARRGAARSRAAAKAGAPMTDGGAPAKASRARATSKTGAKPRRAKTKTAQATQTAEPPRAPRQGFEAESDVEPGKTVQPPGSAELAASVVELIGELAQSGLASGGKLLKDALSRLPRG
jgi:hypothetical protein